MEKEDIQLRCLLNLPIIIDGIEIKSKTLNEIVNLGYSIYNGYLSIFCYKEEAQKAFGIIGKTHYKFLCELANKAEYQKYVLYSLYYFIGKEIFVYKDDMYYIQGNEPIILNENTFNNIVFAIKMQNSLIQDEENEEFENPANERAKQLLEKRKKVREKLKKAKQQNSEDGEPLTLLELISVASCNCQSVNIYNVGNLNLYQFNDQFNRMVLLDNYRVNIRALLAGAKEKDLNMENWMKKIH